MKLNRITVEAAGAAVQLKFTEYVDIPDNTAVLAVLDRHAREIEIELTHPPARRPAHPGDGRECSECGFWKRTTSPHGEGLCENRSSPFTGRVRYDLAKACSQFREAPAPFAPSTLPTATADCLLPQEAPHAQG